MLGGAFFTVRSICGEEELLVKISWKMVTQRMYATVIPSNFERQLR